tara:strand:- start:70 stop:675 length:606 start_codon:yes stop_codon:yes gene_type:complete
MSDRDFPQRAKGQHAKPPLSWWERAMADLAPARTYTDEIAANDEAAKREAEALQEQRWADLQGKWEDQEQRIPAMLEDEVGMVIPAGYGQPAFTQLDFLQSQEMDSEATARKYDKLRSSAAGAIDRTKRNSDIEVQKAQDQVARERDYLKGLGVSGLAMTEGEKIEELNKENARRAEDKRMQKAATDYELQRQERLKKWSR